MIRTEKKIDVVSPKGEVLVSFRITESEVSPSNNGNGSNRTTNSKESKPNTQQNDDKMTDPQKKYLFRIFAEQGIEREEAQEKLKELFSVESLKDVLKFDASKMIESLLAETKGGNGNGSSF